MRNENLHGRFIHGMKTFTGSAAAVARCSSLLLGF